MSYTISVDSDVYSSGDINNRVYYFDFGKLPKGKYSVDWTLMMGPVTNLINVVNVGPVSVYMDSFLGANQYQAEATSSNTDAYFGSLNPVFYTATNGILTSNLTTTNQITLDSLPPSSFFTIKLRYGVGDNTFAFTMSRYVMTIILTPLVAV